MDHILGFLAILIGFLLASVVWFAVFVLPIFYGVPRSLYWVARGWARWWLPLLYLRTPVIWFIALLVLNLILWGFLPRVAAFFNSKQFVAGELAGLTLATIRAIFSRSAHVDLSLDFYSLVRRHATGTGAVRLGLIIPDAQTAVGSKTQPGG